MQKRYSLTVLRSSDGNRTRHVPFSINFVLQDDDSGHMRL
jgi:hypothetical protein